MNLPEFGSILGKGCKVFAISAVLAACAACGGGDTDKAENAPVSSEVEIASSESSASSESASEENTASDSSASETVSENGENSEAAAMGGSEGAVQQPAEGNAPEAAKAQIKKNEAPARNLGAVRDPFLKASTTNVSAAAAAADKARLAASSAAERAAYQKQQEAVAKVAPKKAPAAKKKKVVKIVKPKVAVNGILMDGSGRPRAMISDGNQTREVGVGDKVDKYRIFAIDSNAKTVTLGVDKEHKWDYTLKKETFGAAKVN